MMSWLASNTVKASVRERTIITIAGIAPDIDGLGLVIDPISRLTGHPTNYWGEVHHALHNLGFCLLVALASALLAKVKRLKVALLAFTVFHLHLLCDLIGSRGPDGYQWPLPYLQPFSDRVHLTWEYQWALNAWPNIIIGVALIIAMGAFAKIKGRSAFEIVSSKADSAFYSVVNKII